MRGSGTRSLIKDGLISAVALALLGAAFIAGSKGTAPESTPFFSWPMGVDVAGGLTAATVAFLGIVTLFDLFQNFHWQWLVPGFLVQARQQREEEAVKRVLDTYYGPDFDRFSQLLEVYYKQDHAFVESYEKSRINYILGQLGITRQQFDELSSGLVRMRTMPLKKPEDVRSRLEQLLHAEGAVVVQDSEPARRVYPQVQYYVDLISPMAFQPYLSELAKTFAAHIRLRLDKELSGVTKLVIPYDSNFLLGIEASDILGIPRVIMRRDKGRVIADQPWDGVLENQDCVLLIHDVLVTGGQIQDALEKIRKAFHGSVQVKGLCCLIRRTDPHLKELQDSISCPVWTAMELNDTELKQRLAGRPRQ